MDKAGRFVFAGNQASGFAPQKFGLRASDFFRISDFGFRIFGPATSVNERTLSR